MGQPVEPPASESTSASLLARVRRHDEPSWQRFAALYGPIVYRWCRRWGVAAEDAEDLCQDVFRRVVGGIENFQDDGRGASFRRWLWTIARNRTNDFFRQRGKDPQAVGGSDQQFRLEQIPEHYPQDEPSSADDSLLLLRRALEAIRGDFEQRTWSIFERSAVQEHPTDVIARELGMSEQAVRQAKHRVMKRLREEYADLLD